MSKPTPVPLSGSVFDVRVYGDHPEGVSRVRLEFDVDEIVPEVGRTYTLRVTQVVRESVES